MARSKMRDKSVTVETSCSPRSQMTSLALLAGTDGVALMDRLFTAGSSTAIFVSPGLERV
jgi:hypothetical protein